ncbi:MAG: hypothetical protein WC506_04385 [Candidatus Micrarchaeia archaeon]
MNHLIEKARQDAAEIKQKLHGTGSKGTPKGLFARLKEELEAPSKTILLGGGAGIIRKKFSVEERANAAGHIATMQRKVNTAVELINSSEDEETVYTELGWLFSFMGKSASITLEKIAAEPDNAAVSYAIRAGFGDSQIMSIEGFISNFLPLGSALEVPMSAYDKPARTGNARHRIFLKHPNFEGVEPVGSFTMEFSTKTIEEFAYIDVLKSNDLKKGGSPGSVELINRSIDIHVNSSHIAKAGVLPLRHLQETLEKAGVMFNELMDALGGPRLARHMVAIVSPIIMEGTGLITYAGASFIIKPGKYDLGNGEGIEIFKDMEASLAFTQNARDLEMEFVIANLGREKITHTMDLGNYLAENYYGKE